MIKRALQDTLEDSLKKYPVVGIVGSRQVGGRLGDAATERALALGPL